MRKIGIALGGGHAFGVPVIFIFIVVVGIVLLVSKKSDPLMRLA